MLFLLTAIAVYETEDLREREQSFPHVDPSLAHGPAANVTVHLVPHAHMDTGWLKTVDQVRRFTAARARCVPY